VKGADDALEARWVSPAEIRELPVTKTTLRLLTQIGFISNRNFLPVGHITQRNG
jgi:hypothetical protein